jgi:hypothetical protein
LPKLPELLNFPFRPPDADGDPLQHVDGGDQALLGGDPGGDRHNGLVRVQRAGADP